MFNLKASYPYQPEINQVAFDLISGTIKNKKDMEPINMDFTSLYANVQKTYSISTPHLRAFQRKLKIKKIFNL